MTIQDRRWYLSNDLTHHLIIEFSIIINHLRFRKRLTSFLYTNLELRFRKRFTRWLFDNVNILWFFSWIEIGKTVFSLPSNFISRIHFIFPFLVGGKGFESCLNPYLPFVLVIIACTINVFHFISFSRGHVTLHLAVSVGRSVRPSRNIFELEVVFALLLLPIRPWLDCRVSGLVAVYPALFFYYVQVIYFRSPDRLGRSSQIHGNLVAVPCIVSYCFHSLNGAYAL